MDEPTRDAKTLFHVVLTAFGSEPVMGIEPTGFLITKEVLHHWSGTGNVCRGSARE